MKSVSIVPLAFLFASIGASAQGFSVVGGQTNCVVSLHVGHPAGLHAAEKQATNRGDQPAKPPIPSLPLEITAANPKSQDIVSLRITAHGVRAGSPSSSLLTSSSYETDFSRTVTVAMEVKASGEGTSEISLKQFRSVATIDLDSVTYADGSTWRTNPRETCTVQVDPLMLVATTR